jgi:peptidyl-tRNA hydrolase, PTH1 family
MWLVVGLGNPGGKYERTRHNAGFEVVDAAAARWGASWRRGWRVRGQMARARTPGGQEVVLLKPATFMNESGHAVGALARKHGLAAGQVVVVVDDVDLPLGWMRIRSRGSAGGHNGLRSVARGLGSEEYLRLRIGVGPRPAGADMVKFVLDRMSGEDWRTVEAVRERAAEALEVLTEHGVDTAMGRFNGAAAPSGRDATRAGSGKPVA